MKMSEILDITENESSTENDKPISLSGKTKTLGKTKIIGNLHTCHLPTLRSLIKGGGTFIFFRIFLVKEKYPSVPF